MSCGSTSCTPPIPELHPVARSPRRLPSPAESLAHCVATLVRLQAQWRQHEELRALDDRILRDVGLTREQIGRAARWWFGE